MRKIICFMQHGIPFSKFGGNSMFILNTCCVYIIIFIIDWFELSSHYISYWKLIFVVLNICYNFNRYLLYLYWIFFLLAEKANTRCCATVPAFRPGVRAGFFRWAHTAGRGVTSPPGSIQRWLPSYNIWIRVIHSKR